MGQPKHLLSTSRGTILEHIVDRLSQLFSEVLVVGRDSTGLPDGVAFVRDLRQVESPLVGISSGLRAAANDVCVVIGCDMPLIAPPLVRLLIQHADGVDVVVPRVHGFYEPLLAVYRRSCITVIEHALDEGRRRVVSIYPELRVRELDESLVTRVDPELASFTNLNTPRQLSQLSCL